jgi:hypothetical protein
MVGAARFQEHGLRCILASSISTEAYRYKRNSSRAADRASSPPGNGARPFARAGLYKLSVAKLELPSATLSTEEALDLLLYLTKQWEYTYYSGDGLLQFAGLIAAGLVRTNAGIGGGSVQQPTSAHQVILTEKGKALVAAWLAGDEAKYRESLRIGTP